MSFFKQLEIAGRHLLVWVVALVLGVRRRDVVLSDRPRILVVRLDERLGNLLLLTPLLDSLRGRFPLARIEVLVNVRGAGLLGRHPVVDEALPFRKRALMADDGPLRTLWRLRARRYDLVIDAANPTDPSATQALLVRLSGSKHSVGSTSAGFGRLYSAPVRIDASVVHEIDLRLQLLRPLPGAKVFTQMSAPMFVSPRGEGGVARLPRVLAPRRWGILNVGARLADKRLDASAYASLASTMVREGVVPVVTYGPQESGLAEQVVAQSPEARLAPPTDVAELAFLMKASCCVVSCDTGPMHLAVALSVPTCGIFLSTDPARYGHATLPHRVLDARKSSLATLRVELARWLARLPGALPSC